MGITSGVGIDVTIYYDRYKIALISWLCSGGEGHTILGSEVGARAVLFCLTPLLHKIARPSLYYIRDLSRLFSTDSSALGPKRLYSRAITPLCTKRTHLYFQKEAIRGRSTGSYFTDISVNA